MRSHAERGNEEAPALSPQPSTLNPQPRSGITLVELLITILIISMLAGLILGVAAVATETAREAQTRHMITRLHALLMEQYGTYKTRRVKLRLRQGNIPGVEDQINNAFPPNSPLRGKALAEARLYALREMMLMELPDRWSDVLLNSVGSSETSPPQLNPLAPLYLVGRTDLSNIYLRRYRRLVGRTNTITGSNNTAGDIRANQGAECLYMIITLATGDGEARSQFGENDIGDIDGDGAPEFIDAWGHPISFLRWAPGFDSEVQANANELETQTSASAAWQSIANSDHDPFDLFRVDEFAFRLVPLIFSWGPDEDPGLYVDPEIVTWRHSSNLGLSLSNTPPHIREPRLSPYRKGSLPLPQEYFGTSIQPTSTDNIHNHLLGLR